MKLLLVAATVPEIAPTLTWLANQPIERLKIQVSVTYTGVGVLSATHHLAHYFASHPLPDIAIQGGVAGAINPSLELGSVVQITSECLMDAGAEDADGSLLDNARLGFPHQLPFDPGGRLRPAQPYPSNFTEVAGGTVSLATGTAATLARIQDAFPDVAVETMEGAPFFFACIHAGVPCLQLRGISNYVGIRDRESWKIARAVAAFNKALQEILVKIASPPSE